MAVIPRLFLASVFVGACGAPPPAEASTAAPVPAAESSHEVADTVPALGRRLAPNLREMAEKKLLAMLIHATPSAAAMYHDAEVLRMARAYNGEPSVGALLDALEEQPLYLDLRELAGEWSLEYTNGLPAAVLEEMAILAGEQVADLAVIMKIKTNGLIRPTTTMDVQATIMLVSGEEKVVNMQHRTMKQESDSPFMFVSDKAGGKRLIKATYTSDNLLIWRSDLEGDAMMGHVAEAQKIQQALPRTDVWRRLGPSQGRVRPAAGRAALWRFGLPYAAFGRPRFDMGFGDWVISFVIFFLTFFLTLLLCETFCQRPGAAAAARGVQPQAAELELQMALEQSAATAALEQAARGDGAGPNPQDQDRGPAPEPEGEPKLSREPTEVSAAA